MPADLHYYRVPEHWTREEKLEFLRTHSLYPASPAQEAAAAEQAAHRLDAPRRHPVRRPSRHIRAAAQAYCRIYQRWRAMTLANPGHASLPVLSERLDAAREALELSVRSEDRHTRRFFLVKYGCE